MADTFRYWTSVLKRVLGVIIVFFCIWASFRLIVFYMPFLIAFIISLIMEPAIRWIMKKLKLTRRVSSIIVFIILFGLIIAILSFGIGSLISESTNLLNKFNDYYTRISEKINFFIQKTDFSRFKIPKEMSQIIQSTTTTALEKVSSWIQKILSRFLILITSIPTFGIYFGITILSLYFICTDKIYMLDELEHHLPEKWIKNISGHLRDIIKTLGGYLKAQIKLVLISLSICIIGLYIFHFLGLNVEYPLLIALAIGFVDALPILGSGSIMIPWAIISGINGDLTLGICILTLWIIMTLTRQFIEPRIVSGNIGIHPIFTIIAMYTGFKFLGIVGMFVGPIVLIILKNVFSNVLDEGIVKNILLLP